MEQVYARAASRGRVAPRWWAAVVALAALASCGEAPRARTGPGEATATDATIEVWASPTFERLMPALAAAYEASRPGERVRVRIGRATPDLDATGALMEEMLTRGGPDVLVLDDGAWVQRASLTPVRDEPWVGNRVVVIAGERSALRMVDLSKGECEVCLVLERESAGRSARSALLERGVWAAVSTRVGLFDSSAAVAERVRWGTEDPSGRSAVLGVVFASDAAGRPVRVVGELSTPAGEVIRHRVLLLDRAGGRREAASRLVDWLLEEGARRAIAAGFSP